MRADRLGVRDGARGHRAERATMEAGRDQEGDHHHGALGLRRHDLVQPWLLIEERGRDAREAASAPQPRVMQAKPACVSHTKMHWLTRSLPARTCS